MTMFATGLSGRAARASVEAEVSAAGAELGILGVISVALSVAGDFAGGYDSIYIGENHP
jgi:hypothetical protein